MVSPRASANGNDNNDEKEKGVHKEIYNYVGCSQFISSVVEIKGH